MSRHRYAAARLDGPGESSRRRRDHWTGIDGLRKARPSLEQEDHGKAPVKGDRAKARDARKTDESAGTANSTARGGAKAGNSTSNNSRTGPSGFTGSVSAIGDSVMLGAVGGLQKDIEGLTVVDAEVGLQVSAATDILKYRRASGQLGDVVVVHLGNNGTFTKGEFDQIMRTLSGVDRVAFINVTVPRPWEEPNNEVIAEGVERYPNTALVDWHSASVDRPELFYSDGYHLRPKGQRIYTGLVSSYLPEE
jgi:hypothetical protein